MIGEPLYRCHPRKAWTGKAWEVIWVDVRWYVTVTVGGVTRELVAETRRDVLDAAEALLRQRAA